MQNVENLELNKETGELLNTAENVTKENKPWSVRLGADVTDLLSTVAEEIGASGTKEEKRLVLEHLLKLKETAHLKTQVKGKVDVVENVEKALDNIREEVNTLLRHNIHKEEEIRDVFAFEITELEDKIKDLQDKLNVQLNTVKELKEENKTLKSTIIDKGKELVELKDRYAATDKLIVRLEKTEAENQEKLVAYATLQTEHRELQTSSSSIEKELLVSREQVAKVNADVVTLKQSILDKDKEFKTLTAVTNKEIEHLKATHCLQLSNAILEKETEFKDVVADLKDQNQLLQQEVFGGLQELQKEKDAHAKIVADLNLKHIKELEGKEVEKDTALKALKKEYEDNAKKKATKKVETK